MASRLAPRYSVEDVHRFLFDVPGDGEVSDEENTSDDDGNVIVDPLDTRSNEVDPDYPEEDLPSTSMLTSRGRGCGRGLLSLFNWK